MKLENIDICSILGILPSRIFPISSIYFAKPEMFADVPALRKNRGRAWNEIKFEKIYPPKYSVTGLRSLVFIRPSFTRDDLSNTGDRQLLEILLNNTLVGERRSHV